MKKLLSRIRRNLNSKGLTIIIHRIALRVFPIAEKFLKVHITPANFYSPIPITYEFDKKTFAKRFDCIGIDWNLLEQLRYLREVFSSYKGEYIPKKNEGLSIVDAAVLYAMIREEKPKLMIEVGAGESTKISLLALHENKKSGAPFKFYSIEPYPKDEIRQIDDPGFFLIDKKIQDVSNDLLSSADLLFIDSSHVSKYDSDVNCEILEVIPKLKVGSVVHWHDIVIPTNYWEEWVYHGNKFWNESYMVHSFMLFNEAYKIIWASRYMQLEHFEEIQEVLPFLQREHHLMSFWIKRKR